MCILRGILYLWREFKMNSNTKRGLLTLTECSLMIALSTVLSVFPLFEMPYGGSITLASFLPIVIAAYRHGAKYGLGTAAVASLVQMLLGMKNFSYFTTWQSIVAIALFDYVIAFTIFGLAGCFRKVLKNQSLAVVTGALFASVVRYICHVISGATVWAGLSIPTASALSYSLVYNATYMIPEALVLMAASFYIASGIDFRPHRISPIRTEKKSFPAVFWLRIVSGGALCFALIFDIVSVFPHLQDSDSGTFANGISSVDWIAVIILSLILTLFSKSLQNKASQ